MDTKQDGQPEAEAGPAAPKTVKLMRLAQAALDDGDAPKAIPLLQAAAEREPANKRVWNRLGKALRQAGRTAEAESALQRVVELDPSNVKRQVALSKTAWQQGKRSEALATLEAAAAADPDNLKIQLMLAHQLLGQLRLEDATAAFRRVIAAEPRNVAALQGLAKCVTYAGDKNEAVATLRRAQEIEPENADIEQQIRRLQIEPGEYDWKAEVRRAIAAVNDSQTKEATRIRSAQTLLFYGITAPIIESLPSLAAGSTQARRMLQMARQLDRMGLSTGADSSGGVEDSEAEQLNAVRGSIERFTPGAETLVLVFSGAGDRAFLSLDVLHRVLRQTGVSLAYFCDINRTLFLRGIVGLSDDFNGTIDAIKKMMARAGARRLMLIGHCGGASAALRFGLALKAEAVLAIEPRIRGPAIIEEGARGVLAARLEDLRRSLGQFAGDLPTLYRDAEPRPKVTLMAGAGMEPECTFSRTMEAKVPGVVRAEVPGGQKACLGVALARGLLSPLFSSFVRDGVVAPEILEALKQPSPAEGDGDSSAEISSAKLVPPASA